MTNKAVELTFFEYILLGGNCQVELFDVYKSSIGLINDLKNRSKRYMGMLSDIEGSSLGSATEENNIESNLSKLTISIEFFNESIGGKCDDFTQITDKMMDAYSKAFELYRANEGELTKLLETRKQILFLKTLIRKYKYKINSLQLMNNALLSLSNELEEAKDAYKSNLIQLSTAMTSAIEDAEEAIEEINRIAGSI